MAIKVPHVPQELIDHLEQKFDLNSVLSSETQDQLWFHKGIHHIIDYLRVIKAHREKNGIL
nr:MAG TPA: hypothetical protein [Caudoviricetes sp.]